MGYPLTLFLIHGHQKLLPFDPLNQIHSIRQSTVYAQRHSQDISSNTVGYYLEPFYMSSKNNITSHCQQISDIIGNLRVELQAAAKGSSLSADPLHPFLVCTQLRSLMRNIADELECRSRLVQLKKQEIEKKKSYLESLEYNKSMLANQIEVCSIPVEDVTEIVEEDCRPSDWLNDFPKSAEKLQNWMDDARSQKAALARKKLHREAVDSDIKRKKKLFNEELPSHLTKMEEGLKTVMSVFEISPTYLLNPIKNERLANLYSYLLPLKQNKTAELVFQDDVLTMTMVPANDHPSVKLALAIKLALEPKEIKLHFNTLGNRVVMSVDRSCDFTSEELLHRLVNNEPLLPIYPRPQNEQQRNCNTRYQHFSWLQSLGNANSTNLPLTSDQLASKLINRSFSVQILKEIVDGLRGNKMSWFWKVGGGDISLMVPHLKKLQVVSVTKLSTEQALLKIPYPKFLKQFMQLNPPTDRQTIPMKTLVQRYMQERPNLVEDRTALYSFFEVSINYFNCAVEFLWMVPCNYPDTRSRVKLLHYYNTKSGQTAPPAGETILKRLVPPAGALPSPASGEYAERRPFDCIRMEKLENAANGDHSQYGANLHPNFYMVYQINRLLTGLDEAHQDLEQSLRRYPTD